MLSNEGKATLLVLARKSISWYMDKFRLPDAEDIGVGISDELKVKKAAFVTLTIQGMLRGCIGEIFPTRPLYKSVMDNAVNAAFDDPRFPPLGQDELEKTRIEISVLTEPAPIDSFEKIKLGRDGIILSKGGRRALFLPQVAPEQGWTLEETLSHLALKAELPQDAWKKGCSFQTFQAEVFGEED